MEKIELANEAQLKDTVFNSAISLLENLTGRQAPDIEVAPPEIIELFRKYVETINEAYKAQLKDTFDNFNKQAEADTRLVSYAPDGSTCTLNINGEEVYFDKHDASNQPEPVVIEVPDYNAQSMRCGLEDRNITNVHEAMHYGWECAVERVFEQIPNEPLFTAPHQPQNSEPIYQCYIDADKHWLDICKEDYEIDQYSNKRIVYLVPPQPQTVSEMLKKAANVCDRYIAQETKDGNPIPITLIQDEIHALIDQKAEQLEDNSGYRHDVEKALRACENWANEIPELTDHSPRNAIDTLAVLLLQARCEQSISPEYINKLENAVVEVNDFLLYLNQSGLLTGVDKLRKHLVSEMESVHFKCKEVIELKS